jgi:mannitol 2-dehydrogenase
VGLLPADKMIGSALVAQDFLYGLLLMDIAVESYRVIGSLVGHLYAPESSEAVLEKMAASDTAIVSLTVTESGYFIEDATGRFVADREIAHTTITLFVPSFTQSVSSLTK